MLRKYLILIGTLSLPCISYAGAEKEMLLYCGITMIKPMTVLAETFSKENGIKIKISQGGSEDLYQAAKTSGIGDWYLPGEPSFVEKHKKEGLFANSTIVGHNQMVMVVQKGNPKNVKPKLSELLRKDLETVIGNSESGSVGMEAKRILDSAGLYPKVVTHAVTLASDSRSLAAVMRKGEADVGLSWRASLSSKDNVEKLDVIDLPSSIAKPQPILLVELNSTKDKEMAKKFAEYVASKTGSEVFKNHGFKVTE